MQYFTIGVSANHPDALWGLSQCYDHGYGVEQCYNQARTLLHRAAEANHPEALFRLGLLRCVPFLFYFFFPKTKNS